MQVVSRLRSAKIKPTIATMIDTVGRPSGGAALETEPALAQAGVAIPRDDDVIQELDVQDPSRMA